MKGRGRREWGVKGGVERCVGRREVCFCTGGLRGVWEEERCEEEQMKRNNMRDEMTNIREEVWRKG